MKRLFLYTSFLYLLFSNAIVGQVTQEWLNRYDFNGTATSDIATAIAIDNFDNVYVTGRGGALGNTDIITIKYNAAGDTVWTRIWNGPNNSYDGANAITVKGNAVYVTGYTEDPPLINSNRRKDFATLKYDLDGTLQWASYYNFSPTSNWEDIAYAVDADDLGNVYVTGSSKTAAPQNGYIDYATVKYNSSGAMQWAARYNYPDTGGAEGTNDDIPVALKTDSSGNVYVTGYSLSDVSGFDYATLKYDPNGILLWESRYTMPGNYADTPTALQLDLNGNVYVTGASSGYGVDPQLWYDYATIKYDTNGNSLWVRRFNSVPSSNSVASDAAYDLAIDAAGNVYVTGESPSLSASTYGNDFYTIKYDAAGNTLWESRWDALGFEDEPKKMKLDPAGNVYITGYSTNPSGTQNFVTIKLNESGQFQWSQSYQETAGSQHFANDLVLDSGANVYVTGQSYLLGDDYVTIKYAQESLKTELFKDKGKFVIYPNPATDAVNIMSEQNIRHVKLYDLQGRLLQSFAPNAANFSFGIGDRSKGVYLLKMLTSGITESRLLVKD